MYLCAPVPIIKQNKTFLFVFIKSNYKGMDKLLKIRFQSEKENLFDLNFFNNKIAKKNTYNIITCFPFMVCLKAHNLIKIRHGYVE